MAIILVKHRDPRCPHVQYYMDPFACTEAQAEIVRKFGKLVDRHGTGVAVLLPGEVEWETPLADVFAQLGLPAPAVQDENEVDEFQDCENGEYDWENPG